MTATTIEKVTDAERAAATAAAKAAELRAHHDAERAAEAARRRARTQQFHRDRAAHLDEATAAVDTAWSVFAAAVRDAGDVTGAYLTWRRTQATAWAEIDATLGALRRIDRARIDARIAEWDDLNRTASLLDGAAAAPGFHDYADRLADYNRRRAAFEGIDLDDDAPLAHPGPRPDPYTDDAVAGRLGRSGLALNLAAAVDAALEQIIADDLAAHAETRRRQLNAYLDTGER